MSNAKKPADHKRKAAERLQAEAKSQVHANLARKIVLSGRRGDATVTVLEDPMEWGMDATELIQEWGRRDPESGGVTALELRRFLMAIVSVEDADRIRAIEPTAASLSDAADAILDSSDDEDSDEESLGESQAS